MKPWIKTNAHLLALHDGIQKYSAPVTTSSKKAEPSHPKQISEAVKTNAVKKIQHLWRGYKVKEAFVRDPYGTYLSMVSHDDEQRLLSSIMFGRHEAELRKDAKDRISNPHIHGSAYYHRCDNLSGALLDQIKKEFNI